MFGGVFGTKLQISPSCPSESGFFFGVRHLCTETVVYRIRKTVVYKICETFVYRDSCVQD